MFIAVLFTKAKRQKTKCPSRDQQINKMCVRACTKECYTDIRKKAVLGHSMDKP
jgi:hypothetical protein